MSKTKLTINNNGSVKIEGDFEIVDRNGNTYGLQVSYKPGFNSSSTTINNSQNAYKIFKSLFPVDTISLQEQFVVLYLNRANRVLGSYQLSKGCNTGTIADVRLKSCSLKNAC
jgi:hypothetical protein